MPRPVLRAPPAPQTHSLSGHYAAGSAGALEAVQAACLALMSADSLTDVIETVTHEWPALLSVDVTALALAAHDEGFRAGPSGIQRMPARRIAAWHAGAGGVRLSEAKENLPLFGGAGTKAAIVAIVPLNLPEPLGCGILALGSCRRTAPGAMGGTEMLDFLGAALSRMIARCQLRNI